LKENLPLLRLFNILLIKFTERHPRCVGNERRQQRTPQGGLSSVKPTNVCDPNYFHKVVDCQWACPAHTPVPEYIRLIAEERYADAYMINWESNVFPGILGRTCDRPCEPACRRGRVEEKAVAICRLKRVAADFKGDISGRLPKEPETKNNHKIACVGGGPASLTVARDLSRIGYKVTILDSERQLGGMIRSQIPKFRLPEKIIDEEINYILKLGINFESRWVESLKQLLKEDYDAVFVGTGAPRGKDLEIPGRTEAADNIHIGIDWLSSVAFGHISQVGKKVIVLGGGNTAMDCCRSSMRLGGESVTVVVRSGFEEMKASEWEKEDTMHEGIPIRNYLVPKAFLHEQGALSGMAFEKVRAEYIGKKRNLIPTGEPDEIIECDDVLIAIGQENAFPWIERDIGIEFDDWGLPELDPKSLQSTRPEIFFGGDAAFGPENIIWAVAHGHEAAISIDKFLSNKSVKKRPKPNVQIESQKMGIHEWSYDNDISSGSRQKVPLERLKKALSDIKVEVEKGFSTSTAWTEAQRCLNCDVQTVFSDNLCIECDACTDICPTDCINFTDNAAENTLRKHLRAPADDLDQDLYVSGKLPTGLVMVKDENVCLHCGLCAERCPTGAWDMRKYLINIEQVR